MTVGAGPAVEADTAGAQVDAVDAESGGCGGGSVEEAVAENDAHDAPMRVHGGGGGRTLGRRTTANKLLAAGVRGRCDALK